MENSFLFWIVALPFLGAGLIGILRGFPQAVVSKSPELGLVLAVPLLALALLAMQLGVVFDGSTIFASWDWMPQAGLSLAFRLDGLGFFFAALILILGFLIAFYAIFYLSPQDSKSRFFAYFLLFMGSMLGIVLSENLIQLVIFWELTSVSSFLLIGFWWQVPRARLGAKMALVITAFGGLALLGGVLILGQIVGSYALTDVLDQAGYIAQHPWFGWAIVLILLGVFTKSAQFPFQFWLPHAMTAPTPVSAFLHSATMVKAGIFLLLRLFPLISESSWGVSWVLVAGLITFLLGAFAALFQRDLKGLLAYSTVSHLGFITFLIGLAQPWSVFVALLHILAHASFKAPLFMLAGAIDSQTGTRNLLRLGGLLNYLPLTAGLALVALAAMAGVPLLNGFLSKEFALGLAWDKSWIVGSLVGVGVVLSVAYAARFFWVVFLGELKLSVKPQEASWGMLLAPLVLVAWVIFMGLVPSLASTPIINLAAGASLGEVVAVDLPILPEFNWFFAFSLAALVVGVGVLKRLDWLRPGFYKVVRKLDGRVLFELSLHRLLARVKGITQAFDRGSLPFAFGVMVLASVLVGAFGFLNFEGVIFGDKEFLRLDIVSLAVTLVAVAAAIFTVFSIHKRMLSLLSLGVIGLILALVFVKFSAPDLALTQLSIEVVTLVLLLLALFFLPQSSEKFRLNWQEFIKHGLGLVAGLGAFILTFAVLSRDFESISQYFLENSLPLGGGTNVVNVILVDFRAFDTLGEIVVLALAGLGVFALLSQIQNLEPDASWVKQLRTLSLDRHPVLLRVLSRMLLPLMLLVAIFIMLRGHDLPGGGFIAGLIASVALLVQYLASGISWSKDRMSGDFHKLIAWGLFFGLGVGVVAGLFGEPFLTSGFVELDFKIFTMVLSSALIFDLGVFLVVVGATVLSLVQLGKVHRGAV